MWTNPPPPREEAWHACLLSGSARPAWAWPLSQLCEGGTGQISADWGGRVVVQGDSGGLEEGGGLERAGGGGWVPSWRIHQPPTWESPSD